MWLVMACGGPVRLVLGVVFLVWWWCCWCWGFSSSAPGGDGCNRVADYGRGGGAGAGNGSDWW